MKTQWTKPRLYNQRFVTEINRIQLRDYDTPYKQPDGQWEYISATASGVLIKLAKALKLTRGRKFIEAGCGGGAFTWAATQAGCEATGIEINPILYRRAKRRFPACKFIRGDIMEHDYSPYDIIYFWCPFSDHDKERAFEVKIATETKPGAVVLGFNIPDLDQFNLKRVDYGVHVKDD